LLRLVCVLLLFSQHVGLVHAVAHAAHDGSVKQQGVEQRSDNAPAQGTLSRICALDAALAQVLGGAPSACHAFAAEKPSPELSAGVPCTFVSLEAPAPRSRGPPSLL
jgi:hypothetical protein